MNESKIVIEYFHKPVVIYPGTMNPDGKWHRAGFDYESVEDARNHVLSGVDAWRIVRVTTIEEILEESK